MRYIADKIKGADGKFYIIPINIGLSDLKWDTEEQVNKVVWAINRAYLMGRDDFREEIKSLLAGDE